MLRSWIPTVLATFSIFATNFSALCTASPGTYGLTAGDAANIKTALDNFNAAVTLSNNAATRTPVAIANTQTVRNALTAVLRNYGRIISANAGVADADKQALGLVIRDLRPSRIPVPGTSPILGITGATPLQHTLTFRDQNSTPKSRAKPAGVTSLELHVSVGSVEPTTPSAAPFKKLVTRTPFAVDFDGTDVGKTAFYYGRWINRRGEQGPWSALAQLAIV